MSSNARNELRSVRVGFRPSNDAPPSSGRPPRRCCAGGTPSGIEPQPVPQEWTRGPPAYASDRCLHQLFEHQAELHSDAVAVRCGRRSLTYGELDARADRLAVHLRGLGVGPDSLVPVCLHRSFDLIVAILAVHKAGGAYVPLDPGYPRARLTSMLEDCAATIVLAGHRTAEIVAGPDRRTVFLDDVPTGARGPDERRPEPLARPDDLAYVIFTSGSTGRPKGVQVEHRAAVNRVLWMRDRFDVGPRDRVLLGTPLSFDPSVWQVQLPLAAGGVLVLAPEGAEQEPAALVETLRTERVSVSFCVPTALEQLLTTPGFGACHGLRHMLVGGEVLSNGLVRRFARSLSCRLHNDYGPTEATCAVTLHTCRPESDHPNVPIGRPIVGTRVLVLDGADRPVPVGVEGELVIGGVQLARGYLSRPEHTARAFVHGLDPAQPEERWYRSGDRARWRADGRLEFRGRIDGQVKLRGYRIELGEIESALAEHDGVGQAVVVVRDDTDGERRLVAYHTAGTECPEPSRSELRAFLEDHLPLHMVPAVFVRLETLPLAPSGKVDRAALPCPETVAVTADQLAPRTPAEHALAEVWAEVLRLDTVGVDEDFFGLGGHSLSALRVVSRCRELFGADVPVRALFKQRTIERLAATLPPLVEPGAAPSTSKGTRFPNALTGPEEHLWLESMLDPTAPVYHVPCAVHIDGPLDESSLQRCLDQLAGRHEALRAAFPMGPEGPTRRVGRSARFPFRAVQQDDSPQRIERALRDEARRPFDLEAGPLARALLLRLGPRQSILLLTFHHLIVDDWSLSILIEELGALYRSSAQGCEPSLPPVQETRPERRGEAAHRDYWRTLLAGARPELDLDLAPGAPRAGRWDGDEIAFDVAPESAQWLDSFAARTATTFYAAGLAAFLVALHSVGARDDLLVGADRLLDGYAHPDIALGDVLPSDRSGRRRRLSVAFIVRDAGPGQLDLGTARARPLHVSTGTAKFALTLFLERTPDGLRGRIEYRTSAYARAGMERLARAFLDVLERARTAHGARVAVLEHA